MRIHGALLSRAAILSFEASQRISSSTGTSGLQDSASLDLTLWSEKRIDAFRKSLAQHFDQPLAVLRISKIRLEVPVFDGTDDLTLNRGAGRIADTAFPGESGNIGIAGHRDGFFRGLKDITIGDTINLAAPNHSDEYVVDNVQIVNPDNVGVLRPTSSPSLTLVTCYPFYFIGSAPQRYIVHASIVMPNRNSTAQVDYSRRYTLASRRPDQVNMHF